MAAHTNPPKPRRNVDGASTGRRIGSADIARLVGVARSTVSKVLNGYPNISEKTRQRVLDAVHEHQYYPNLSAQVLAGKQTNTLGLFFFSSGHFSEDILVNFMISRAIESAAALGRHMLVYIIRRADDPDTSASIREVFHQHRVSGGVFIGARNREPIIEELVAEGFVVGVFDESPRGRDEPNRVIANFADEKTASSAIEYLVSLGHRRIALIHGDQSRNAGPAKKRGFLKGLRREGLEPRADWQVQGDFTSEGGHRAMKELIQRCGLGQGGGAPAKGRPTAIACANDNVAFGVLRAAEEAGVEIPAEISVVGIDGHPLGAYVRPALTTLEFDFSAMIHSLIHDVISVTEGSESPELRREVFTATLAERDSCVRIAG